MFIYVLKTLYMHIGRRAWSIVANKNYHKSYIPIQSCTGASASNGSASGAHVKYKFPGNSRVFITMIFNYYLLILIITSYIWHRWSSVCVWHHICASLQLLTFHGVSLNTFRYIYISAINHHFFFTQYKIYFWNK